MDRDGTGKRKGTPMADASTECNGCVCLQEEDWPKGARVARCFGEHNGPLWCGRVVNYSRTGTIVTVQRPAWCREKK